MLSESCIRSRILKNKPHSESSIQPSELDRLRNEKLRLKEVERISDLSHIEHGVWDKVEFKAPKCRLGAFSAGMNAYIEGTYR